MQELVVRRSLLNFGEAIEIEMGFSLSNHFSDAGIDESRKNGITADTFIAETPGHIPGCP